MLIKNLVSLLLAHNPNAHAYFMTQRKQPFENRIGGVVARSQMADQEGRHEAGIARDDVFLTVGTRIRPGSLSAWIVAERPQPAGDAVQQAKRSGERDAILEAIAREHLGVESLTSSGNVEDDLQHLRLESLHNALLAAYHAAIDVTLVQNHSEFF
jgi:hypothetical protein